MLPHSFSGRSLFCYSTDKSETTEELKEELPVEPESQLAITNGSITRNVVSVLLNFEIKEVQEKTAGICVYVINVKGLCSIPNCFCVCAGHDDAEEAEGWERDPLPGHASNSAWS